MRSTGLILLAWLATVLPATAAVPTEFVDEVPAKTDVIISA